MVFGRKILNLVASSICFALCLSFAASAQGLEDDINFYASESCGGRVCGTPGGALAAEYTAWRFGRIGLRPFGSSYMHRFDTNGRSATNVIGMVPAFGAASASRYVIMAAHFDNLAPVDERFYPGADSNASGVAAMLGVAKQIVDASAGGKILPYNIIFVALDARQPDMAGAAELWRMLVAEDLTDPLSGRGVKAANIVLFVNLDTIGSTLAPITAGRTDYLLMLGGSAQQKALLKEKNLRDEAPLELGFDYYGNPGLTEMFYRRVSEQKIFLDHGVPAVMFTSGITDYTNRPEDTPDRLDFDVLLRRTLLISRWLESVR